MYPLQPKLTFARNVSFYYLAIIAIPIIFCGCNNRSVVFESFRSLNETLSNDAEFLLQQNELLYHKIDANSEDPVTAFQTAKYISLVSRVKLKATEMNSYLENIKDDLLSRFGELQPFAVRKFSDRQLRNKASKYVNESLADEINQRFEDFRDSIFRFDSVDNIFINRDLAKFRVQDSSINKYTQIDLRHFEKLPFVAVLALINNCQVITRRIEFEIVVKFYSLTAFRHDAYEQRVYPLASVNTSLIKLGNTIEVTAGIGAFSMRGKPEITINNKKVELGVYGVATDTIKPKRTGSSWVEVRIAYTDVTGEKKVVVRKLKYEVIRD